MKLFINSNVPVAAGVSSSAAFCVSAAIATMRANDLIIDKATLSKLVVYAEQRVGT